MSEELYHIDYFVKYRESGRMTLELLDTDSDSRGGSDNDEEGETENPDSYLDRFLGMSISDEARNHLSKKPVFLCRSVRRYRKNTRHKIVPRPEKDTTEERYIHFLNGKL